MTSLIRLADVYLGQAGSTPPGGTLLSFVPIILMVLVFYFLIIRPANKQRKEHEQLLQALKKGDEVVTNGGLWARVVSLDENVATVELNDKMKVRILRDRIAGRWASPSTATQK
jgi:preprotein translocase subunit YajC